MKFEKEKTTKVLGVACMVIGFGINMLQNKLDDKKMERMIEKEVQKRIKTQ